MYEILQRRVHRKSTPDQSASISSARKSQSDRELIDQIRAAFPEMTEEEIIRQLELYGGRDEVAPFHCPMPPVLPTERLAHLGGAGDLLRCGISTRLMSAPGHSRPIDMTATRSQCPLHLQYCPFLFGEYRR
jgi:hypothetical protein